MAGKLGCKKRKFEPGMVFGRLTVVEYKAGHILCTCSCGTTVTVRTAYLGKGTNSCGCLRREVSSRLKRKPNNASAVNAVGRYYRRNAKARTSVEWKLSMADVDRLIRQPCEYCGLSGVNETVAYTESFRHVGIDRVDNRLGYVIDNCVPCCVWCNRAKSTMTVAEFEAWVIRVAQHRKLI